MYDLIIKNATVIDGTGKENFAADVAIINGKIAKVAAGLTGSKDVIDAAGLVLTPGFIDSHSHSDLSLLKNPVQTMGVEQGITFAVTGHCGGTLAPSSSPDGCATVQELFDRTVNVPMDHNIAVLVGHGTIRKKVIGTENRPVTDEELKQMEALLEESLQAGAIGMSLGLTYVPGSYSDIRELTALAKVVARHGGVVTAHIRNEGDTLIESVEEFLTVLKNSGCPGVISHLKAADKENWGKVKQCLAMVDAAEAEGVQVYADAYPYCASATSLLARFVPRQFHPRGITRVVSLLDDPQMCKTLKAWATEKWGTDMSWVMMSSYPVNRDFNGKNINEIAEIMGMEDRYEAIYTLLRQSGGVGHAFFTMMCEEDVKYILSHPKVMIGTDSNMGNALTTHHPRRRGTFTRVLGKYVRDEGVTTLPEMIRRMTSLPAKVYGLSGKGIIKEGYDADLCVFDPLTIQDTADYVNCASPNKGLHYVLIDGKVVLEDNVFNGTKAGKMFVR